MIMNLLRRVSLCFSEMNYVNLSLLYFFEEVSIFWLIKAKTQ